ncbi:tetratricopeptide repeat protein [uncultured Paludibaculum sp.]|uniref:tetratricopeptide repeat protein n=1 Tax=uncultured Paludibaculum sp. TaxID=1765020 RepID=UPI002AAAB405|nr:tetratricopeptide repeat protein [uncultured Paludibaculum sp.]
MGFTFQSIVALFVCLSTLPARAETPAQVESLLELGHFKRAKSIVEAELRANAKDAQAHAWMAKILINFNDMEGAFAAAERAVAISPNNAAFQGQLAEAAAMMADKSNPLKGFGYVRRMKKAIDTALAIDPKNTDTLLVEMMFAWKAPAIAGGDRKQAVRIADRIVSISPVWGYLAHARLLQDQGQDAVTEEWLKKAVQAAPGFYRARVSLARFYCCTARNKRMDMAEKAANDAIAVDPSASGAYEVLARVYATQQRWADLDNLVARAEKAVPDDLGAYESAARALMEIGQDFRRAERYLNKYLSQPAEGRQPSHAEALWVMANLYIKEGRKADAIRELQAALRIQTDYEPAKADLKRILNS